MTRHVVGIDAGGTKTVGLLADEHGRVLAEARGGPANIYVQGELEVEKVLYGILDELSGSAGVAALCLGVAGVDRPRDETVIRDILRRLGHRERARVTSDALIALVAGSPSRTGIVLLAGTGSIAFGIDSSGRQARAGGYGHLLADEGSGYWLGLGALRAAVRSLDNRDPKTTLAPRLLDALGAVSLAELVPNVYEPELPKRRIAALAPLVEEEARRGDATALRLLDQAAEELALTARAAAAALRFDGPFPLLLAGGVFKFCPSLEARLLANHGVAGARPEPLQREPAAGAVALAVDLLEG